MSTGQARRLIEIARKVIDNAYAPYSGLKVAAALLTREGRIFTGVNIENASFGLTICAERVAIFKAVSEGYRDFVAIAVTSSKGGIMPCGACRQVMAEFSQDMEIVVGDEDGFKIYSLRELLPESFGGSFLSSDH